MVSILPFALLGFFLVRFAVKVVRGCFVQDRYEALQVRGPAPKQRPTPRNNSVGISYDRWAADQRRTNPIQVVQPVRRTAPKVTGPTERYGPIIDAEFTDLR